MPSAILDFQALYHRDPEIVASAPPEKEPPMERVPVPKLPPKRRRAPAPAEGGIGDFLNSRQGKAVQREVIRGVFGMLRKRL